MPEDYSKAKGRIKDAINAMKRKKSNGYMCHEPKLEHRK
jgi:hypothetical protein